jgi:outer membrane receptor protein involved in Fe transport
MSDRGICRKFARALLASSTLAVLALVPTQVAPAAVRSPASAAVNLNIPAQDLGSALSEFARQSNQQLLYSPDLVRGKKSSAVSGQFAPADGLKQLLSGSGVSYSTASSGAFLLSAGGNAGAGANSASSNGEGDANADIVVTGTNIHGRTPVGSKLRSYSRDDIDRSGAGTVGEFARNVPENFSNIDTIANNGSNVNLSSGIGVFSNSYNGTAFNLRGLGPSATLTLFNGTRLAPGGNDGSFVDTSSIPVAAIDHVEILVDGASAIYGSDAIGGVVNIIPRRDYDGAETRIRYGQSTDGGGEQFIGSQTLGKSWDGGNALISYTHTWNGGIDASQRSYTRGAPGRYDLVPKDRQDSVFLSATQEEAGGLILNVLGLYSDRKVSTVFNSVNSFYGFASRTRGGVEQYGGAAAGEHPLGDGARVRVNASYFGIRETNSLAQTVSIPPSYSSRTIQNSLLKTDELIGNAIIDGRLFTIAGGEVKAAVGASFRREGFSYEANTEVVNLISFIDHLPRATHDIWSAFGEVNVPLVSDVNAMPLVRRLKVSGAVRYDHYSDFGGTTNPKFGVNWTPVARFDLRATYGTSFKAPLLAQLNLPESVAPVPMSNPSAPGGFSNVLRIGGGNPDLKPETAKVFTVAGRIVPIAGVTVDVSYFDIRYRDRISALPQAVSNFPFSTPLAAPFLTLNPSLEVVQGFYDRSDFTNPYMIPADQVFAIFDTRINNIAASSQRGIDATASYEFDTSIGHLSASAIAIYMIAYRFKSLPRAPGASLVGTFGQPTKWHGNANLGWSHGDLDANLALHYVGSYRNDLVSPAEHVSSWTTADFSLTYRGPDRATLGPLRNLNLTFAVTNITDKAPHQLNIPTTFPGQLPLVRYDPTNASPFGRQVSIMVVKRL